MLDKHLNPTDIFAGEQKSIRISYSVYVNQGLLLLVSLFYHEFENLALEHIKVHSWNTISFFLFAIAFLQ